MSRNRKQRKTRNDQAEPGFRVGRRVFGSDFFAALAAARKRPERAAKPGASTATAAEPRPGSHAERRAILEKRRTP